MNYISPIKRTSEGGQEIRFHISTDFPYTNAIKTALESILSTTKGKELISPTNEGKFDYYIEYSSALTGDKYEIDANDNESLTITRGTLNNIGTTFMDKDGVVKPIGLERTLAHELSHYSLRTFDPEQLYNIDSLEDYRAFNANPNSDTRGGAIDFANTVLSQLHNENATFRTQYYGTADVNSSESPILDDLKIHTYVKPDDFIKRAKIGTYNDAVGEDVIRTDAGDNTKNDSDLLVGLHGRDVLVSGGGRDFLFGAGGDDDLLAGEGADILVGGEGDDKLSGGTGEDELFGEDDVDILEGGVRGDLMPNDVTTFFDSLSTTLYYDDEESDILVGGSGSDKYYVYNIEKYVTDTTPWDDFESSADPYSFFDAVFIAGTYGRVVEQKFDVADFSHIDRIRDTDGEIFYNCPTDRMERLILPSTQTPVDSRS
ncbi:MAG: calcium-binding protein [Pseudomonadota bacterium]